MKPDILFLALTKAWRRTSSRIAGELCAAWMRACGVEMGRGVTVRGWCHFWRNPAASIRIGDRVRLNAGARENPVGGGEKLVLVAGQSGACLEIGPGSGISASVIYAQRHIRIGARVLIGAGCAIYDYDFHSLNAEDRRHGATNAAAAPVEIENDVWLGARVMVLKGVRIGEGSVIGAGSVVTGDIPPRVLAAGVPARVVREL